MRYKRAGWSPPSHFGATYTPKMKYFLVGTLILSALACYGLAAPKANSICNTCQCLPSDSAEHAKNIQCTCDAATRAITTTVENMKGLPHLESFTVVNCDSVTFQQRSFSNKHDLSNVILKHVKTATFPLGVFDKLDSLKIEDVDDLRLMAKAFMGAVIGEIAIRNTTIHEVPEFALYDVKLRKLQLADLKIGTIKSNSTLFLMGEQSNLNVDRCTVDEVETKGLELKAQNLRISSTTLTHLAPSSTIIDAAIGIDILKSTFGKSDTDGMRITSKNINIVGNTFYSIPITLANTIKGARVTITKNFINGVDFSPNVLGFLSAEFINNSFLCDCDFGSKLQLIEFTAPLVVPNFENILSNNSCQSNCTNKMLVKEFLEQVKAQGSCTAEELDRCAPDEPSNDDHNTEFPTDVSPRSGRHHDHDEHHDPMVTTVESALHSGNSVLGASSFLLVAILASLRVFT